LTLGERAFYLPAPSYPCSFPPGQQGANSKQAGFMGPRLLPHMIKVIQGSGRAGNGTKLLVGLGFGVGFFVWFSAS